MTTNTFFLRPKLTFAGRDAAVAAKESGVGLDLTHVQLGSAHYAISGAETALREPVSERIPFAAGDRPADGQLRLVAIWTENVGYQQVREMIFWAGDVPAYIWSTEEGAIAAVKTDGIPYVLFVDIGLNSEAESVVEIVVDPEANMALAALLAHEVADDAHPQYIRRDILPSELRMCRGEAVESEDPNNVRIELPEEVDLPHYAPGQRFTWKAVHTNTGPMTMDVDGLGAMPLQKAGTRDLEPADIEAGCMYDFYVDDDMQHFQLAVGVSNHGHADSASRLRTPRAINGVLFDGTQNIVIEDDTKEPIIQPGAAGTFYGADKSWKDFGAAVRVATLGALELTAEPLASGDTVQAAMGKVQGQINTLDLTKAPLASPELTGKPTAPTAPLRDSSQQIANTAFVQAAITALVGAAPETLNEIHELASAIGNDPNFSVTLANAMAGKADRGQLDWISGVGLESDNPAVPYMRHAATNALVYLATREAVDSKLGQDQFDRMMRAGLGSGELSHPYMMRDDGQIAWLWGDTNAAEKLTAVQISTPAADAADGLIANLAFVRRAIATLVNSAPAALDTLQELAAALGNDPNFATTMLNALAGKANRDQLDWISGVGLEADNPAVPYMRRASDGADVYLWADTNGHGRVADAIAAQAVGTVGTYALLLVGGGTALVPVEPGSIVSGSNCRFSSAVGDSGLGTIGPAPVGSWMVMGYLQDANLNDANSVTLCKRVA